MRDYVGESSPSISSIPFSRFLSNKLLIILVLGQ
jgi:hypothetical protein